MPDIIYFKQGHITCKHLFIFCGFYCFDIQAKSKENRFFIQFYGLGVNFCAIIFKYKFERLCCQPVNYMLLNGRISGL